MNPMNPSVGSPSTYESGDSLPRQSGLSTYESCLPLLTEWTEDSEHVRIFGLFAAPQDQQEQHPPGHFGRLLQGVAEGAHSAAARYIGDYEEEPAPPPTKSVSMSTSASPPKSVAMHAGQSGGTPKCVRAANLVKVWLAFAMLLATALQLR